MSVILLPKSCRAAALWHQWFRFGSLEHIAFITLYRLPGYLFRAILANAGAADRAAVSKLQVRANEGHAAIRTSELLERLERRSIVLVKSELADHHAAFLSVFIARAEEKTSVNGGGPVHIFAREVYQQIVTEELCSGHLSVN